MLRLDMFFIKVLCLVPGLQNLCSVDKRFLFSDVICPRLLISKAVTVVLIFLMSVRKCAYLLDFSKCLVSMFLSSGQVSSKIWNLLCVLSHMVISGFKFVTHTSGGTVPPPAASCPMMSLWTVYFVVSKLLTTKFTMLLCLQVHLPVSKDTLHMFRQCAVVCLPLHSLHLSDGDFFHLFKLAFVGRVGRVVIN